MKKRAQKKKEQLEKKLEDMRLEKELKYRKGLMARPELDAPSDVIWSGLGEWKEAIAEEVKAEGGGKSETKKAIEDKARRSLLNKVHNAVTAKLMAVLTEISSQIMSKTEEQIRASEEELGAVVNALNGIIMTYHMGKLPHSPWHVGDLVTPSGAELPAREWLRACRCSAGDTKRYLYLRRYASDKLTELISSILDEAADVTDTTKEMTEKISGILETKKADASKMMHDKISETLAAKGPQSACTPMTYPPVARSCGRSATLQWLLG